MPRIFTFLPVGGILGVKLPELLFLIPGRSRRSISSLDEEVGCCVREGVTVDVLVLEGMGV